MDQRETRGTPPSGGGLGRRRQSRAAIWRPPGREHPGHVEPEPQVGFVKSAILRVNEPDFADIALAYLHANGQGESDEEQRRQLREALPGMLAAFEGKHGPIVRSYITEGSAAACLTDNDELIIALGQRAESGSEELVDLLRRCESIGYTAWHRLHTYDRRSCQLQVWGVVEDALRLLDATPAPPAAADARRLRESLQRLAARLDAAEDFMLRCAARRTQSRYLKGMLVGGLVVGALLIAALVALVMTDSVTPLAGELLLVAMAGAVGAVFSVLARMTSGSLQTNLPTLDHDMRKTDLRLIAALRPAVGLGLALAVYVLFLGGIVPIEQGEGQTRTALLTGLAFLSGFSERLAQDVFIRSGQGLLGSMGDSPSTGPAAGLAPPPGARR
ncbi:MAG TPA: hypothetical protein VGR11_11795 [Solirubrobacteraceae bacterium]|nr:hypothetical protein [Solirubrobacteraceae bacterium]